MQIFLQFKEGFLHSLTLIRLSVTSSHRDVTFTSLSVDPDPQALSQSVVHPTRDLRTSKLLLHIKDIPPHLPCPSFFILIHHSTLAMWAVPPALSYSGDFTILWPHESSSSSWMFPRLQEFTYRCSRWASFQPFQSFWGLSCLDIPTLWFPSVSIVSSLTVGCNVSHKCFSITQNKGADVNCQCIKMYRAYFVGRTKKFPSCLNSLVAIRCPWYLAASMLMQSKAGQ